MKFFLQVACTIAFCAVLTNGFLFWSSYKDGCDPDPCKHKSKCILDNQNKNLSTCECTDGYHGKVCELETGCKDKPCKHGKCNNIENNLSKYECRCEAGFVGETCKIADPCLKNPCPVGQCVIDKDGKHECKCPPGFTHGFLSSKCTKRDCKIERFKGKNFESRPKVYIDPAILRMFEDLDELAALCRVKVKPIRSFTLEVDKTLYHKKDQEPFYIGRGLEFELHDAEGKILCNKVCLEKKNIPIREAKCFIYGLIAIKWSYSEYSPGIVHEGSHLGSLREYNLLKEQHQEGCKETKF